MLKIRKMVLGFILTCTIFCVHPVYFSSLSCATLLNMDFKRRCKELSKYLYCLCHKCPLHFSMSDIHPKKVLAVELFFIHLYISVVLKGLDRAESSDIHGFVAHAWDVKCPSIRKMGASLWISDVIFFHPIPSSSCSTCGQFVRNSEMPPATLNFLETKITWKDCYLKWKKCQQIRSPVLKG